MTNLIDDLRKLSEAHRSRANMNKLSALLDGLEETYDQLGPWLEKAVELNGLLDSFADATEELAEEVLPAGVVSKLLDAMTVLLRFVPSGTDNLAQFTEFQEAAKDQLESLDESMEDRGYTADDRDTLWYETADQAGSLALALEELEQLGSDPEEGGPEDKQSDD